MHIAGVPLDESAVMVRSPAGHPGQRKVSHVALNWTASNLAAVDDPTFDHWVSVYGLLIGEAHSVTHGQDGVSFALVRLFSMPDMAGYESIDSERLKPKVAASMAESSPYIVRPNSAGDSSTAPTR
jgi:hypothetical protein